MRFKVIISLILSLFPLFSLSYGAAMPINNANHIPDLTLKIVQVGDPVLRNIAKTLTKEEILSPNIQQLIALMKNTMRNAPGVGLAAPQIGVPLQIAVIEDREEYLKLMKPEELKEKDRHPVPFQVIINPKLTLVHQDNQAEFYEGCLSLDGFVGRVPRALAVKVEALNEKGEAIVIHAKGWYARILQHEIDHLNGTLYIDHMHTRTFSTVNNYRKILD
jgi:peptide deformylase